MTYYRLLRDNKESGPFAEDELIAKGFKPYDLIWVEGKSAGWRYPSEIPAFKNFAPAIEEQPYDRFYKKQPAQKLFSSEEKDTRSAYIPSSAKITGATENNTKYSNNNIQPQQFVPAANVQSTPDYTIQPLPGRHIHVTLPSGNTVNLTTLVAKKENKEYNRSTDQISNNATAYTEAKQLVDPIASYNETPVAAQPARKNNLVAVTSIKEEDSEEICMPQPKQYQASQSISWGLIAASFIGFATLVGLGIMIGLGIGRSKSEQAAAAAAALRNKPIQTVQAPGNSNKPAAIPDGQASTSTDVALPQPSASNKELVQNAVVKNTVLADNSNEPKEPKKTPAEKLSEATKNKSLQEEPVINTKPVTANIEKTLSLTANDFKTGAFGGISGLRYSLFNGSRVPLESVEVEVDYIQANDKVFKTEKLLFKDIPAGTQATIDAPSSSRGVKVSTRIIKINAKEGLTNTTAKS